MAFQGSGRFELESKLGEGGMGIVYEAVDRERNMRVALKTLRHLDAASLYRFKREFRALSDVSHPNIVALYELVSHGDDWFFTMELVEGDDFITYVRGGSPAAEPTEAGADDFHDFEHTVETRVTAGGGNGARAHPGAPGSRPRFTDLVDPERLRACLRQLAQALHALHGAGLVHRDLKPSNVRVTRGGRAVLMDFGIVAEARDTTDTPSGDVAVGTPAYMAPEQAAGDPPTAAADWYAFGTMMYLALTGRLPFRGPRDKMLLAKQSDDPAPPQLLVDGVPEELGELCTALLSRAPNGRPRGAEILRRLGARPETASDNTATGGRLFVGREDELQDLRAAYAAARRQDTVCVTVRGESGLGKSTLVRRFVHEVGADESPEAPLVLTGRCHERESLSYKAFDGVIDDLSRTLLELPQQRVANALPEDVDLLTRLFPVLRRVPGIQLAHSMGAVNPRDLRARAIRALRTLLTNLADWRPLIIHIDDIQWADHDSLELLIELLRDPMRARILLLIGLRTVPGAAEPALEPLSRALALNAHRQLHLGPLSTDDQRLLATQLLRGRALPPGVDAEFWAQSEGSPLLLAELVRYAQDAPGALAGTERPTLEDVLARRIESLPEPARVLVEVLAIAGEPLPLRLLADAVDLSADDRERASAVLRVANLARVARPGMEPHLATYHDKIRETICTRLPDARVRELHMRLAQALERWDDATIDSLAHHWLEAGDPEQAAAYLVSAARTATDKLAFGRAAELYGAALGLSRGDRASRLALLEPMAAALSLAGRYTEAAAAYTGAAAQAEPDDALDLHRLAADNLLRGGHIADGLARLTSVMAQLGFTLPRSRTGAMLKLGLQRARLAVRGRGFKPRTEKDISARELGQLDTLYAAATSLGMLDHIRGGAVQSRHLLDALRAGEEKRVCRALAIEVPYLAAQGGRSLRRATELAKDVMVMARRIDDPYVLAVAHLGKAACAFFGGKLRQSAEAFTETERRFTEDVSGAEWERTTAQFFAVQCRINLGDFIDTATIVERTLDDAQRRDDVYTLALFGGQPRTWSLLAADDPAEALRLLDDSLAVWPTDAYYMVHYITAVARVIALLYAGDHVTARTELSAMTPKLKSIMIHRMPWLMMEVRMYAARAELMARDRRRAMRLIRRVASLDMPITSALAAAMTAAVTHWSGDADHTQRLLEEAIDLFRECDAEHWATSCQYHLGELVGGSQGEQLRDEAVVWMRTQRIAAPERMMHFLVPGFAPG